MNEWKEVSLGEVCKIKYGKDHKKLNDGNVPVYGSGGIMRKVDTYIHDKKSVLIPRKGTLSNLFLVNPPFWTVDTLFWTDIDTTKVNVDFLYFSLKLQNLANLNVGTAVPSLTTAILNELKIQLPPLETQQKIAKILSCLDEKIELNNKINANLEEQAQAIFNNMFREDIITKTDSYLPFSSIANFKYGKMPKKDKIKDDGYPIFSGYKIVGFYTEKMFDDYQLIIVARGVGGTGDIKYTPRNSYLTNLSIAIFLTNTVYERYVYQYLRLNDMKVLNTGSAQPQITISSLEKYLMYIPTITEVEKYSLATSPMIDKIRNNSTENEKLKQLRDTLLPKLMNGVIDVDKVVV